MKRMRRSAILFLLLFTVFAGAWVYKSNNPTSAPQIYNLEETEGNYWWDAVTPEETSTNWKLSEGVPDNYIPVPGMENVFMVVDEDGYIIGYKKGTKDENGQWTWEDTNPDIPENYEAIPGLKDVYKVTYDDGSVRYFKYVRNQDDTYAFVEVDAKGNMLGMEEPTGSEVPDNYEEVGRNQYAVKNENGVTVGYKERVPDENSESGVTWVNIDEPDSTKPTDEQLSMPSVGFNLTTDVTGKGDATGGTKLRAGYTGIAASDMDGVAVPTLMPEVILTGSNQQQNGNFVFTNPQTEINQTITETYFITPPPDMTQATIITQTGTSGGYTFTDAVTGSNSPSAGVTDVNINMPNIDYSVINNQQVDTNGPLSAHDSGTVTTGDSGVITSTEVVRETKMEGADRVTYEKTIESTYKMNENGELVQVGGSVKIIEGPTEVSRERANPDVAAMNDMSNSLKGEYDRMSGLLYAYGGNFTSGADAANRVANLVNEARASEGKPPLGTDSQTAYRLAVSRAAMFALTGNASSGYGDLSAMCSRYGVSTNNRVENAIVVNSGADGDTINAAFQKNDKYNQRVEGDYLNKIAIAVAELNGKYYICEVLLEE